MASNKNQTDKKQADTLTKIADTLGQILKQTTTAVTAAAARPAQVAQTVAGATAAFPKEMISQVVGALTAPIQAVSGIANAIKGIVATANPAVVERFQLALDDALATIGHAFIPVMDTLTDVMRLAGDTLNAMMPALRPIVDSTRLIIGTLSELIPILAELETYWLQGLGWMITNVVVPAVRLMVDGLKFMVDKIREFLSAIGIETKSLEVKRGSSMGAAYRPAQYSSIEELGRQTSLASFSVGHGEQGEPDRLADIAKGTNNIVDKIEFWGKQIYDKIPSKESAAQEVLNQTSGWRVLPSAPGAEFFDKESWRDSKYARWALKQLGMTD